MAEEEEEIVTKPAESSASIEKTWDDIIPETERKKLQEEDEQKRQLDLYLPPRQRNTVKKVSALQEFRSPYSDTFCSHVFTLFCAFPTAMIKLIKSSFS